jgi:GntR family transcriptional regulator
LKLAEQLSWQEIAAILRERILSGQLKPGQPFPTNKELINEFGVYVSTVQNAVNALIREGLVVTSGPGNKRRIVRPLLERSVRRGGFLTEFGPRARLEILELKIVRSPRKLPAAVLKEMDPPVLRYLTRQWRDEIPVALSDAYIPGVVPLKELKSLISDPGTDLYRAMESLGMRADTCEESLIAGGSTPEEQQILNGAPVVVRITRKVYNKDGRLLELCFLTNRADCYEFLYRFPFEAQDNNDKLT